MSGSPKYSTIAVSAAYAAREARLRRERAAERRRREQERVQARARMAAARAAKAEAEEKRRAAVLAERRAREQAEADARGRRMQAEADARDLAQVRALLERARAVPGAAPELSGAAAELDRLASGVGGHVALAAAIEAVRARVVELTHTPGPAAADADRPAQLATLAARLDSLGAEVAARDPEGRAACESLLARLRDANVPGAETRFDALLGTVEHALTRHAATAAALLSAAPANTLAASPGGSAARVAPGVEPGHPGSALAAQDQQIPGGAASPVAEPDHPTSGPGELELAEAADRWEVVRGDAENAVADARDLGEAGLAERLGSAVRAAGDVVAGRDGVGALEAVELLERELAAAEERLDELQLAYTRRSDLAQALQEAMVGEGFAYSAGEDQGDAFVLHFERPTGATYETTVATEADGTPVLVYHVDGEPDIVLTPTPGGAVCDSTEELLGHVHELLRERTDFAPGVLSWEGKPPGRIGRPLPGTEKGTGNGSGEGRPTQ